MPIRIAMTKVVGTEQFVADVAQWNPVTGNVAHKTVDEMVELLDQSMRYCDIRAMDMQSRNLEVEGVRQFCTPTEWMKIRDVLDIMAGRNTAYNVVTKWQSEKEENEALEQSRLEYAMNGQCVEVTQES